MNFFENYININKKRPITKWVHYLDIYEKHFARFKNKNIKILEIGVGHGGSLQMWKEYFGQNVSIVGLDINPDCKNYEESQIQIEIGSQFDSSILNDLISKYKDFDIIIDDGSHVNQHMIFTFNYLFKFLNENGIYLIEDVHTSYYANFGGGLKKENSFIEFVKNKIDEMNLFYIDYLNAEKNYFTKYINNITLYDSVVIFEKKFKKTKPQSIYSFGNGDLPKIDPLTNINLNP